MIEFNCAKLTTSTSKNNVKKSDVLFVICIYEIFPACCAIIVESAARAPASFRSITLIRPANRFLSLRFQSTLTHNSGTSVYLVSVKHSLECIVRPYQ